jgi:hypothetical protein
VSEVGRAGYVFACLPRPVFNSERRAVIGDGRADDGDLVRRRLRAWSDGVAFAMMRLTLDDTNWLQMTAQVAGSPLAFCSSNVTLSPSFSVIASLKPWVAASRAGCWTIWQIPTVYFFAPPPHAASDSTIIAASNSAIIFFFIIISSYHFYFIKNSRPPNKRAAVSFEQRFRLYRSDKACILCSEKNRGV